MRHSTTIVPGLLVTASLALLAGCSDDHSAPPPQVAVNGDAASFGVWTPGPHDDCTKEIHDSYSVVGPDGKRYPTWHPPIDPATGCHFGHEHGRDPRGSHIYARTGPIPFGYANEQLDTYDPAGIRHEDHFGHKIEWANDVQFNLGDGLASQVLRVTCNVLTKLHQGTHSKDAFTNNLHELVYYVDCNDGTRLDITVLTAIGTPGEFVEACDNGIHVDAGTPTPSNSPDGGGQRRIPDQHCVDEFLRVPAGQNSQFFSALHESWETSTSIRKGNGHTLAAFNPYFQVFLPSRFYDPALANLTGRVIDACFHPDSNGELARGQLCNQATANGTLDSLAFDDPRSPFNGAHRVVDINGNFLDNADGPEIWYTDPMGGHASTSPFPGSIRQFIAKKKNAESFRFEGPAIGDDRDYGGSGVHAPN
ncbi:MAG TPA: hypothetical protein VJN95_00840 [Gemmatimonadales bacterium]|nr:hypothetical protein [Gemmatimonadales bacterium]